MMPDGDTAAHLRKQVGGLFLGASPGASVVPAQAPSPQAEDRRLLWFEPFRSTPIARNEPEGWSFNLRCNTSWIVLDFVHALWSAYDDRQPTFRTRSTGSLAHLGKRPQGSAPGASLCLSCSRDRGSFGRIGLVNRRLARNAENDNPPAGQFLEMDGVRLHYVERGSGAPLVLLHGNGSMIQDFESSGLIDLAARNYRVIVIDRPGFGHSDRPRNVVWTPAARLN